MVTFDRDGSMTRMSAGERAQLVYDGGLGRVYAEYMLLADWNREHGWHSGRIVPFSSLDLDPATSVLLYGHSVFEGMKAYRQADGGVAIFRPVDHARRFRRSARRLALPELPEEIFVAALDSLVGEVYDWVPSAEAHSLYLRPSIYGSHRAIGFHPEMEARFLLTARPTGSYFPRGVQPVSVWVSHEMSRAAPGGTGDVKCVGNYAGGLLAEAQAAENGCDEALFLDATERRWIEELGGMNVFFVFGTGDHARLLTPALTGTILPGNTRAALLTLASDFGIDAQESQLGIDQFQSGVEDGSISEAFACGTAAVVTPIGLVKSRDRSWTLNRGEPGPVTLRLRRALMDIQYGRAPDKHAWMHRVERVPATAV